MKNVLKYFFRGLLLAVPTVVTGWVCYQLFTAVDSWLGVRIPGVGFVVTLGLITLIGFLGSNLITKGVLAAVEDAIDRLPFVRLVYNATKELIDAFVGEKKRFDKPVIVTLSEDGAVRGLGFITHESMEELEKSDAVVVYLPFSYSIAGWTCLVPASRVRRLQTSSPEFMAFVVSGGATDFPKLEKPSDR